MRFLVGILFYATLSSPLPAQQGGPYELPIRQHVFPNGL